MKKAKIIGKKTLSVFLAVLMVLTAWVWVAPTEAEAVDVGEYYVKISWLCHDTASDYGEYKGYDNRAADNCVGISLYYDANNGTGSTSEEYWSLKSKMKTKKTDKLDPYTETATISGFPTSIFVYNDNGSWLGDKGVLEIFKIEVASSSEDTLHTIWEGSMKLDSTNQIKWGKLLSDYSSTQDGSDDVTISTSKKAWNMPKADSIVWNSSDETDIDLSSTETQGYTRNFKYVVKDQYGVIMGDTALTNLSTPVSYTLACTNFPTLNNTGSIGKSSSTSPNLYHTYTNGASEYHVSVKVNDKLRSLVDGLNTRTVTLKVSCGALSSLKTFNISDSKHTITFDKIATDASDMIPSSYDVYYGESLASQATIDGVSTYPTSGNRTGYTFLGMYDAITGGNIMNINEEVTASKSYYAQWKILKYVAIFTDRNRDNIIYIESDIEHGSGVTEFDEAASKLNKIEFDDVNHYILNESDVWTTSTDCVTVTENIFLYPNYLTAAHTYDAGTAIDATCQHAAGIEYKCTGCDYSYIQETSDVLGEHAKSESYIVDTEATCTTAGSGQYFCTVCGATLDTVTIPAKGHSFKVEVTKDATCTKEGTRTFTCTVCDYSYSEEIPLTQHNYVAGTTVDANCQHSPYTPYTCSVCGDSYNKYEGNATTNHNWTINAVEDVANSKLTVTGSCSVCSASFEKEFALTEHNFTIVEITKQPTCTVAGEIKVSCADSGCNESHTAALPKISTAHSEYVTTYTPATCSAEGSVVTKCKDCDTTVGEEKTIAKLKHSYDYVRVEPTCTTAGSITKTCENCGDEQTEPISATGHKTVTVEANCQHGGYEKCGVCNTVISETAKKAHDFTGDVTEVAATCTVDGIKYTKCKNCDAQKAEILAKTGHDTNAEWVEIIPATCTGKGLKTKTCSRCGIVLDSQEINALDHDYKKDESASYAPTCTTAGAEAEKCSRCGDINITVVQPLGHKYENAGAIVETDATCTTPAYTTYKCDVCDSTRVEYTVGSTALPHDFTGTETIVKEATCESDGHKTVQCNNCNATTTVIIPLLGHTWGEWDITKEATNNADGEMQRTCSNNTCTETVKIPAGGHEWDNGTVTEAATCTETGTMVYKCINDEHTNCTATFECTVPVAQHTIDQKTESATCTGKGKVMAYCSVCDANCEKPFSTTETPAVPHTLNNGTVVAPTCTTSGYTLYECTANCGFSYKEYDETKPANGHTYVGEVTKAADCTNEGEMTYTCQNDNSHTYKETIPATGHTYDTGTVVQNQSCTDVEKTEYKCACGDSYTVITKEAKGHTYENWTVVTPATADKSGVQKGTCACGDVKYDVLAPIGNHTFTETVTKNPTCTEKGEKSFTCSAHTDCSANYTAEIPALGHTQKIVYTAPTCIIAGTSKVVCSVESCKAEIMSTSIPATGIHDFSGEGVITDPGCTTEGEITYTCETEGCTATKKDKIPAKGHNYVSVVTPAKCEEEGKVVTTCSSCGDSDTVTLAALNHNWNAGEIKDGDDATCTESGTKTYTCTICGETKTETIAKLGHDWSDWTVTPSTNYNPGSVSRTCSRGCTESVEIPKGDHNLVVDNDKSTDATCSAEGTLVYKCKNHTDCGITVTVTLDKIQHEFETTKKDATCEGTGTVVTKCKNCDTATITTTIPAKGHSYTGTVTKEPSCTEEGVKTYTCAHDSTHTYTETIKKLPHTFESEETVAATCTTRGYEKYACSCGENYVKFTTDEAVGHSYKTVENSTTATCTEGGKLTLKCEKCSDEIIADVPALGHDYVEDISAATTATCKTPATKTYKCNNAGCGNTYVEYVSGTVAHTWGNWTTIQEVTTTSHGIEKRECSVCYVVEHKTTSPTGAHEFENKGEKAATCTEEGYINWVCKTHTDCEANYIETLDKLPHTEKIAYTDPTCTAPGSTKIICDICKVTIGEEKTIPALGHTWDDGKVKTQPTCQTEGVMTYECTVCDGTKTTAIAKNPDAHVYSTTTTEANCTAPATTVYKCACGDEKTVVTNFTLGHKWETEKTVEIPATCTSTGIKSTHCADCSETKDEETIPALNHTEKTEKIEATCTAAGYSAKVCEVCNTLISSVVITDAKGHSWKTETTSSTCTDCATETKTCTVEGCGATETTITGKPTGHTWGEWTIVAGQRRKIRECKNCDATEECLIPTSGHNWNSGEETKAATCYKEGEMTYTCQGCEICTAAGTKATETIAIPKLAHTYIEVTYPATCDTDGSAVVKCSVEECGYVAKTVTLPKTGHTLVRNTAGDKAATCTEKGWYSYKCDNAGCTYTEIVEVSALGHNYIETAEKITTPTCTENGSKKYECSRCDAAIVTEIPALGHSFTETTVVAPTCTDKGYTIKSCSNSECSEKYVVADSFTDAANHKWSEWETVTPATNDSDGLKKHICTVANCGAVEYAPIPMLGHQWNDGEVKTAATCEATGVKEYTCIKENCPVCNGTPATYTEVIPALGHKMASKAVAGNCLVPSYIEWTCENNCGHAYITVTGTADGHNYEATETEMATCDADGEISYKCKDCGAEYTEVTPKLGHNYETSKVDATCTTSGYTLYTCKNNTAHTYKEFNSEPNGHSLGAWTVTLAPTETVDGTKERSCSKCNYKETQIIPALIHKMVEAENVAATCTTEGHITYKCSLTHEGYSEACTYSYTVTLPAVAHSLITEKSEPNCDKDGFIRTKCNNDACDYVKEIKIEKLGHNWNDGVTTPSTCQKQGNILYTCLRCGGTKTVMLELAQHTMVLDTEASKAATCTSRGYETYKCSADGCTYGYSILGDKPTGHQETKVETTASTCKMSGMKKTICEDCNTILSVEVLPLAEHTYSSTVKAPTCTGMGYTVYACDVCGNTYKDDYKSTVPHNFDETITENVTIVDATCTTDGSKTVKCKDCDATDVTTLPATGHINTRVETVPSTCIKKGTEKVICACGVTVSEKELPLTDHNYEVTYENGVYTYTCKQEGCKHSYTETVDIRFTVRFFAADKKTVIKTESVILNGAATAPDAPAKVADGSYHYTFSEWDRSFTAITSDLDVYPIYEKEAHYGGEATCTEKALCEECNTPYGETDSSKHVMATKLTPATCENDGELLHYCTESGCAYRYTEAVNKLGHSFGKWETYQNGNCATPYISIRKCQNYGCKEYEQRESYGSHTWYIQPEIAPTCTTVGYSAYKYCTTCGIEVESVVIPKLEHQDNNGDGSCDYCAYTESVPTCNCMCHSTGFMKFIYSIVRFFWMITKSTPSCSCGARHY